MSTGLKIFLITTSVAVLATGGYFIYRHYSHPGSTAEAKKNRKITFHR